MPKTESFAVVVPLTTPDGHTFLLAGHRSLAEAGTDMLSSARALRDSYSLLRHIRRSSPHRVSKPSPFSTADRTAASAG